MGLASVVMILGYAILAVPTGIVTVDMVHAPASRKSSQSCPSCCAEGHYTDAVFCKRGGGRLN